jgi:ketosteroid isomerase-like protein
VPGADGAAAASAAETAARDANETVVRRIFDAFARRDVFALRGLFAPDAVWTVPGDSAMAGVYRGSEAILRFLGRLPKETDGTYRSELVDVLASSGRAAAVYRASGRRRGKGLDIDQVLLFRLEEGAVQEVLALPSDPAAFEEFWAR